MAATGQEVDHPLGAAMAVETFLAPCALAHSDLSDLTVIHIFYPQLSVYDILKRICWELGFDDSHRGTPIR